MFINIEDKMFSNNNKFNAQRGVNATVPAGVIEKENESQLDLGDKHWVDNGSTTVLGAAQSDNLSPTDGQAQRNLSSTWDNNNVEAGSNPGFTDNFADLSHFSVTASHEPFGNVVYSKRNVNAQKNITPVVADYTRLAAFDNASRPYRSNSISSDLSDDSDLDGWVVISDEEVRSTQRKGWKEALAEHGAVVKQKLAKWVGADPNKEFFEWSSKQQIHACGIVGGLLIAGAPIIIAGAGIIGIGAVVLGGMFGVGFLLFGGLSAIGIAGVKTVQGLNWAAKRTIEGTKSAARNITSGISHTVGTVGATLQGAATETDYQEALHNLSDELKKRFNKVRKVYNQEVEGVSDNVGLSKKEKRAVMKVILKSIVSKLDSEIKVAESDLQEAELAKKTIVSELKSGIEGVERKTKEAELAEQTKEIKGIKASLDRLTQKRGFFAGLDVNGARKLFSGQQKSLSNKDRYSLVTVLAGNSDKIIGVICTEVQKAYDKKSELANNALNAAGKPDRSVFYGNDDSGVESDTTSNTTLSRNSSRSGSTTSVHANSETGFTTLQRRHSHDGATSLNSVSSDVNGFTLRRAQSLGNLQDDANSVSDGVLNKGSAAAGTLVIQAEVHNKPTIKPAISADSGVSSPTGGSSSPIISSQDGLKKTGNLNRLVYGDGKPNSHVVGTSGNVNQHLTTVVPPIRTWAIEV